MTDKTLQERLAAARKIIGILAAEGRGPRMSIPVRSDEDEDFVVAYAIDDAKAALDAQAERIASLERRLHEIAEEWAGAECGEPVTAQEAYAIQLARRMYQLATGAK